MSTICFIYPDNFEQITGYSPDEWNEVFSADFDVKKDYWREGLNADCVIILESQGMVYTKETIPKLLLIEDRLFQNADFEQIKERIDRHLEYFPPKDK